MAELTDVSKHDLEALIQSDDWGARATFRALWRRSLFAFSKTVVCYNEPRNLMTKEVFKERQDWIQRVVCDVKRGLLADPRSYIKSTGCTRSVPPWLGIQRPDERYDHPNEMERALAFLRTHPHIKGPDGRYAVAGDTKSSAAKFTGSTRRFYLTNPLYRWAFPETIWDNPLRIDYGKFTDEAMFIPGRRQPDLPDPFLQAIGTETAIVGGRLDGEIVNDLVGDHNWRSTSELARLRDFVKTSPSLLEVRDPKQPTGGFLLIEGNNWTLDDINAMVYEDYPDWEFWRRGVFKCYVHLSGSCGRWGHDNKDCAPTKESLWPERYPDAESLARLEAEVGPVIFAAQYLNDYTRTADLDARKLKTFYLEIQPVKLGNELQRLWCITIPLENGGTEVIPLITMEPHVISVDPATSEEGDACRTAISWFARDRATNRRFCIDVRADRFGPDESVNQFIDLFKDMRLKAPGRIVKPVIEKVAAQSFMASAVRFAQAAQRLSIPPIEMIPPARGMAKQDRIRRRVGNILNQGLLYVRAGIQLPAHELRHFPTGASDWLDSCAQAEEVFLATFGSSDSDELFRARKRARARRQMASTRTGVPI